MPTLTVSSDHVDRGEARAGQRWLLPVLAGLFFLSGISGLIYQSLWLRMLSLVFGVTVYAASTVLASFMAGLALGTVLAGRLTRRVQNPLAWFGAAEIGIGLTALATPAALDLVSVAWLAIQAWIPQQFWALTLARFVCSSAVLLVPTMLMGSTLPLVVQSSLARGALVGPRVGVLYACNTAGAITGALLAGFVLIGAIGIARSFQVGAAVNTTVGLVALALSWSGIRSHRQPAAGPAAATAPAAPRGAPARLVPAVFAVSGFAALALEVVWFRMLVLIVAATTYAFTTMLAAVLFGIAAGSALATPLLQRSWNWPRAFGLAQIATGFLTMVAAALYLEGYRSGWTRGSNYAAALMVILPPALAMGLAFPIGIRAWTGSHEHPHDDSAARVARLYALNVAGAIVGSAAAGFLLIPALGTRLSLILLAACFVGAGLLLAVRATTPHSWRLAGGALAVIVAFGWAAARVPSPFSSVEGRRVPPGEHPFFLEEGKQTTVGVYSRPTGGRVLYLDGMHQADDSAPMVSLHRQIGLLPVAVHPAPRKALIIGLGGGVTAGAVSEVENVQVTIVELSESVVRGAAWFRHVNSHVLERPTVRLHVDDGRNFLLTTRERFDVITADIIQPVHAGAGSLYSAEYFRLARNVLAPGGVMLQWIGTRTVTQYQLMARTFLEVFPHATAWVGGTLYLGTTAPLRLHRAAFESRLQQDGARRALASIELTSFDALLSRYTAGPEQLRAFLGTGPLLTDDRPLVEFHRSLPRGEPDIDTSVLSDDPRRWVVEE